MPNTTTSFNNPLLKFKKTYSEIYKEYNNSSFQNFCCVLKKFWTQNSGITNEERKILLGD